MSDRSRIILVVVFFFIWFYRKKLNRLRQFCADLNAGAKLLRKLPGPSKKDEHFILGHMGGPLFLKTNDDVFTPEWYVEHVIERLQEISKDYRQEGLFRFFGLNSSLPMNMTGVIVPTSINVVREILSHKAMEHFNKGIPYEISHPLIGDSILSTSREEWAPQRPIVERGFAHEIVGKTIPKIVLTANELADKWEEKARQSHNQAVQDVTEDMLRLTVDVIGRAAFGYDFHSTTSDEGPLYKPFQTIFYTLERRMQYIHEHFLRNIPFLERNIKFNEAIGKLDSLVGEIQCRRKAETQDEKVQRDVDFLDMLMKDPNLSDTLVRDNIKTLLFAGHDTTGAALAWFFYLMAKHPHIMSKVREEILQKFGKHGDPNYEDLETLNLLNACFLETLRLYPSAGFTRQAIHDLEIGGYTLPRYAEILILPYILHRDERYWGTNCNEFGPERFLDEGFEQSASSQKAVRMDSLQSRIGRISKEKAFFPFSLGPRNCVGRPLALAEMRTVAVKLLQRFTFELTDDKDFREVPLLTITLNPASIRLVPILMDD